MSKSVFFVHRSSDGERLGNHYDNAEEAGSDAPGNHYRVVEYVPVERHRGDDPPKNADVVLARDIHGRPRLYFYLAVTGAWQSAEPGASGAPVPPPIEWLELPPRGER